MIDGIPDDFDILPGESIPFMHHEMDTLEEVRQCVVARPLPTNATPSPRYIVYYYHFFGKNLGELKTTQNAIKHGATDCIKQVTKQYEVDTIEDALFMAEKFVSRFLSN